MGGRRCWSADDKARIEEESLALGATVSEVARRHDIRPQQLFGWRRGMRIPEPEPPMSFVPALVEAPAKAERARPRPARAGRVDIELEIDGVVVRVCRGAEARTVAARAAGAPDPGAGGHGRLPEGCDGIRSARRGPCLAPDRKAERATAHLAGFKGVLQVDGYAGYRPLAETGDLRLAFCWAHVRRRFYELAAAGPALIASEALERIASLYAVETDIRGQAADERRRVRQERSRSIIDRLRPWLKVQLKRVS